MSYDISLIVTKPVDVLDLNYTYNVSPMFRKAFGEDGINSFHGKTGKEASPFLKGGIIHMKENEIEYKKLNPKNNWGNYEGALSVLEKMLTYCEEYPDGILEIH